MTITKKNRKGSILIMILFPSLNVILYDFRLFSANCLMFDPLKIIRLAFIPYDQNGPKYHTYVIPYDTKLT